MKKGEFWTRSHSNLTYCFLKDFVSGEPLSVVATTRIGDDVVRCEYYCGDLWQMGDNDKRVTAKAAHIRRELEEGCARLALQVRAGIVEAGEEHDTACR